MKMGRDLSVCEVSDGRNSGVLLLFRSPAMRASKAPVEFLKELTEFPPSLIAESPRIMVLEDLNIRVYSRPEERDPAMELLARRDKNEAKPDCVQTEL